MYTMVLPLKALKNGESVISSLRAFHSHFILYRKDDFPILQWVKKIYSSTKFL